LRCIREGYASGCLESIRGSKSAELAKQFRDSKEGLNSIISEGSKNLSLGQKQLVCLARALDEATTTISIDMKTDAQVQETSRR